MESRTDLKSVVLMTQGHVMEKKLKWIWSKLESLCFCAERVSMGKCRCWDSSGCKQKWKNLNNCMCLCWKACQACNWQNNILHKKKKKKMQKKKLGQKWCVYSSWFFGREVTRSVYKKKKKKSLLFPFSLPFPRIPCWHRHYLTVAAAKAKVLFDFFKQPESRARAACVSLGCLLYVSLMWNIIHLKHLYCTWYAWHGVRANFSDSS